MKDYKQESNTPFLSILNFFYVHFQLSNADEELEFDSKE